MTQLPQKNVEEITPNLIAGLQDQKIPVLGITQKRITTPYAKDFAGITSQYLVKLGIHLEKTLSYMNLAENEGDANYFFIHGLVFTQNKSVGPGIISFLERNHYFPKRVVMVDNSTECLNEAEEALKQKRIEFKGLQYTANDGFKESVNVTLATIEFFELMNQGRVMLDEEAKQVHQSTSDVDYDQLLDNFILEQASQLSNQ